MHQKSSGDFLVILWTWADCRVDWKFLDLSGNTDSPDVLLRQDIPDVCRDYELDSTDSDRVLA